MENMHIYLPKGRVYDPTDIFQYSIFLFWRHQSYSMNKMIFHALIEWLMYMSRLFKRLICNQNIFQNLRLLIRKLHPLIILLKAFQQSSPSYFLTLFSYLMSLLLCTHYTLCLIQVPQYFR